jgi:Mrp family chromosome partitioning ATPase
LNVALAASRDGLKVLMVDADRVTHALTDKMNGPDKPETGRLGWLNITPRPPRIVKTANGIAVLPGTSPFKSDLVRKAIAQARSSGDYDLVVIDGPATPWGPDDRKLIDVVDGLAAILPVNLDINDCMEDIITSLGGAERKLIGVVVNELDLAPAANLRQRSKQYA